MDSSDKLTIARAEDLITLCGRYGSAVFSDFLDGAEQAVIEDNVLFPQGLNVLRWGGYEGAEKRIIGVFPEWQEPDKASFPICCLKIESGMGASPSHRDFMGSILALGIFPSKLGDIIADSGYVFLHTDIAGYVKENLHKIGRAGVRISVVEDMGAITVERKYRTIGAVCASERLDAVTAAAAGISRTQSATLIEGGLVKLNHRVILKPSATVNEGDLLSVRGSGRFLVHSFDGTTRKNRMHITLKQYI